MQAVLERFLEADGKAQEKLYRKSLKERTDAAREAYLHIEKRIKDHVKKIRKSSSVSWGNG